MQSAPLYPFSVGTRKQPSQQHCVNTFPLHVLWNMPRWKIHLICFQHHKITVTEILNPFFKINFRLWRLDHISNALGLLMTSLWGPSPVFRDALYPGRAGLSRASGSGDNGDVWHRREWERGLLRVEGHRSPGPGRTPHRAPIGERRQVELS